MTTGQSDFPFTASPLLRLIVIFVALLFPICPVSVFAQSEAPRTAGIEGEIMRVTPAPADNSNRNLIGTVLIEDESKRGTAYDKASVSVTTGTRLFREDGGGRRTATFDDLRVGIQVRATFAGPALMSYPVRVAAGEIVIAEGGARSANDGATDLPPAARRALDANFLEWRVAEVSDEVKQFLANRSEAVPSQIITGDFDGNGREDYAVNLRHSSAVNRRQTIAVLLRDQRGRAFIVRKLETIPCNPNQEGTGLYLTGRRRGDTVYDEGTGLYLTGRRRGDTVYDYEARRRVRLGNDTIEVNNFEKSSWVYVYRAGRFRKVFTGD